MNDSLIKLFEQQFNEQVVETVPISAHASTRRLVRIKSSNRSVIGVAFNNIVENRAFISYSRHFLKLQLPVPEIYSVSSDETLYIQQDLGDQTLFDLLKSDRDKYGEISNRVKNFYKEAIRLLSYFQVEASNGLDYSLCVEGQVYDKAAMLFDCNRFVKELIQRMGITFNSQRLEKDFDVLTNFLALANNNFFMYRDFQSRNIMVKDDQLFFIDYQSGRHGALQYDLASLLYQSQARLPEDLREEIVETYLAQLSVRIPVERDRFLEFFDGFILIRLGLGENKEYFLKGIPFAVTTFLEALGRQRIPFQFPEITSIFAKLNAQLHS
jgi:aminoglycoside/choline kinase family phosphotransferase